MTINDLQISTGNWHTGLNQANHIRNFFMTEPEIASQVVTMIYNRQNGYKNAVSFLTGGLGKAKEMNDIIYRWPLMGDARKAVAITRAVFDNASSTGIMESTFKVGISEKWFTEGDVLLPDDPRYKMRVMGQPTFDGVDYIYTLQLLTNSQTFFIPSALLAVGKELSKEYNLVENDGSRTAGDTHLATPFWLQNYMSTHRKHYSVTGAAHDKVMIVTVPAMDGKTSNFWVKLVEWNFWTQWMDEVEILLMFGPNNVKSDGTTGMKGASGNPVYSGAGLEDQIAPSNKRYYTSLTESTIRDFMNDLSFNGTEGGPREYEALCGRGFMDLFDRAMKTSASRFTLVDSKFITGSGQELALGGQFNTYVGLNGDRITLREYKYYNDTVRNRLLHPQTGLPAESYKATFLNFKSYHKGEPNIQKVYTKGRELITGYIPGMYTPYGPNKDGIMASTFDGYEFHCETECGIMLKDPTDAAQLLLDVDSLS